VTVDERCSIGGLAKQRSSEVLAVRASYIPRWRIGRGLLVSVVAAATALSSSELQASAATGQASAVITSVPLPDFEVMAGSTGAVTSANESVIFGHNGIEGGLEQFLVNKEANAYIRSWYQPGKVGTSVQIVALAFNNPSYPSAVMTVENRFKTKFNVPGVSGALGLRVPPQISGASTSQDDVLFLKGTTLVLVLFNAQPETVAKAGAIKVAQAQFRKTIG
jgi:hypothetical protein